MTQRQQQTPIGLRGRLTDALFGAGIGNEENMVSALDDAIPLQGASHADVVEYVVEIPMRYVECFLLLSPGTRTTYGSET